MSCQENFVKNRSLYAVDRDLLVVLKNKIYED
jgi:hypothetical protein